jgi:hypothetical protein
MTAAGSSSPDDPADALWSVIGAILFFVMMSYARDFFSTTGRPLRRWPHFANALVITLCIGCSTAIGAPNSATLDIALNEPLARFSPLQAIGGALDGHGEGETAPLYTPLNLRAMSTAGLGELTYRLRAELGVQAWHFDASGSWSEPARTEGYWTGSSRPPKIAPAVSWGYELPRRGDTIDQAEDSGYSRLDDGSPATFWKSDPYLDSHFTHEADALHPQWVLLDLGRRRALDALRIAWAAPYATRFRVQLYLGGPDAVALAPGRWIDFQSGSFRGRPGTQTLRLARAPVTVRFVRLLMSSSSHTALTGSHEVRDRLGYAIRELYLGTIATDGRFRDLLVHAPDRRQTTIYVSSTDPWHRAVDLNRNYEQPSFQTVLRSGLTRGRPMLVPVPILYGTPQNAVAELRYLRALRVPLRGVELGEEPDGQLVSPEDYGALYLQFARAIRRVFPHLPLGGPAFASSIPDWAYWPDTHGDRSWTHRFVSYLRARQAMRLLDFFSFEWYPFDDVCAAPAQRLERASRMLRATLERQHREGIPRRLPVYVTEYGYSAYAGEEEVDMAGALFDADTVGTLLADGAKAAYLYGYEPNVPIRETRRCDTWGNLMLLRENSPGAAPQPVAAFWETQMLTHDWVLAGDGMHTLYAVHWSSAGDARRNTRKGGGRVRGRARRAWEGTRSIWRGVRSPREGVGSVVHAYALGRPDGRLSLLLVNLSPAHAYRVAIRLSGAHGPVRSREPLQEWELSSANYAWHAAGAAGTPSLDRPPLHRILSGAKAGVVLPPYSITVLRSALG